MAMSCISALTFDVSTMATNVFNLQPGATATATLVVGEEHTAPHVGSGVIRVLATPVLVNLMEAAALACAEKALPAGHQSLGIALNIRHVAATPVGMHVRAEARLDVVEGRTLTFSLIAHDETDLIGDGTHQRVVVNIGRFDERLAKKVAIVNDRLKTG